LYCQQVSVKAVCRYAARWLILPLWGLTIAGCAIQQAPPAIQPPAPPVPSSEPLPMTFEEQQRMIMHLLQVLAEKEAEISDLRTHQQDQVKELKESTSEAARAEDKLRRFANQAEVASHLAEVEIAMESLRATLGAERKASLQGLAQRLLDDASNAFKQGDYSTAANLVAQAEQFIEMLMDNHSMSDARALSEIPFKVSIPLKIKVDSHLRRQPNSSAVALEVLEKTTSVVARSYHGPWLHVQTEVGQSGWVLAELLEAP